MESSSWLERMLLFSVGDHDFMKVKLIASVAFLTDIPERPDDKFFREKSLWL